MAPPTVPGSLALSSSAVLSISSAALAPLAPLRPRLARAHRTARLLVFVALLLLFLLLFTIAIPTEQAGALRILSDYEHKITSQKIA